jgi:hypothetical protein
MPFDPLLGLADPHGAGIPVGHLPQGSRYVVQLNGHARRRVESCGLSSAVETLDQSPFTHLTPNNAELDPLFPATRIVVSLPSSTGNKVMELWQSSDFIRFASVISPEPRARARRRNGGYGRCF